MNKNKPDDKSNLDKELSLTEDEWFLKYLAEVMSIGIGEDLFIYYDENLNKIVGIWEAIILLAKGIITPSLILMVSGFPSSKWKNMISKDTYGRLFKYRYKKNKLLFGFIFGDFELFLDGFWRHSAFEDEESFTEIKDLIKFMMLIHGPPSNFNTSVMKLYYEEYESFFKQQFDTQIDVALAFHRFVCFNKNDLKVALKWEKEALIRKDEISLNKKEYFDSFLKNYLQLDKNWIDWLESFLKFYFGNDSGADFYSNKYELNQTTAEICKWIWSDDIKKMTSIFSNLMSNSKEMNENIVHVLNGDVTRVLNLLPKDSLNKENLEKDNSELMTIYNLIQGEEISDEKTLQWIFEYWLN
jgi:hypothetical protein